MDLYAEMVAILDGEPANEATPDEPQAMGGRPTNDAPPAGGGRLTKYAQAALQGECERVAAAPKGERNATLNDAAFRVGRIAEAAGLDPGVAARDLEAAALAAGLEPKETRATVASGLRGGQANPRGIVDRPAPLRAPGPRLDSAHGEGNLTDPVEDLLPLAFGPALAAPLAPIRWLCRELHIAPGRVTLISSLGGVGKTMLAQEMALAVASGQPTMWGSAAVGTSGPVVHFDFEATYDITRARYQRLAYSRRIDLAGLGDRIALSSMPPMYLTDARAEDELVRVCQGRVLGIVDNLRAACPGADENSSEIRRYLDLCTRVTNKTGCVMIVLVHEGKPSSDPTVPSRGPRGSVSITDATQHVISLTYTNGYVRIEGGKSNIAGAKREPLYVQFVDEGEKNPATDQSVGVKVEWLPPEQVAHLQSSDHAFDTFTESIFAAVATNGGRVSATTLAAKLKRDKRLVCGALEALELAGRIENRAPSGARKQPRWFAVGNENNT